MRGAPVKAGVQRLVRSAGTMRKQRGRGCYITVFLAIGISACRATHPVAPEAVTPAQFVYEGWKLGTTTDEVWKHLGAPVHLRVRQVLNRHAQEQTDEIRQLEYDGATLTIYKVNDEAQRELPMSIVVTNPRYEIGWGLKVGTTKEDVQLILGNASETVNCDTGRPAGDQPAQLPQGDCGWDYSDGDAGSEVTFWFEGDRVYRIEWSFYAD